MVAFPIPKQLENILHTPNLFVQLEMVCKNHKPVSTLLQLTNFYLAAAPTLWKRTWHLLLENPSIQAHQRLIDLLKQTIAPKKRHQELLTNRWWQKLLLSNHVFAGIFPTTQARLECIISLLNENTPLSLVLAWYQITMLSDSQSVSSSQNPEAAIFKDLAFVAEASFIEFLKPFVAQLTATPFYRIDADALLLVKNSDWEEGGWQAAHFFFRKTIKNIGIKERRRGFTDRWGVIAYNYIPRAAHVILRLHQALQVYQRKVRIARGHLKVYCALPPPMKERQAAAHLYHKNRLKRASTMP
jgi:hypothetical protein